MHGGSCVVIFRFMPGNSKRLIVKTAHRLRKNQAEAVQIHFFKANMTSVERRKARKLRRMEKRQSKKTAFLEKYNDFNLVTNTDNLYRAFKMSRRGVSWKESVQRYENEALQNINDTKKKLLNGESVQKGFVEFQIHERGKVRHIRSVHISERIVQKCLCDEVLVPIITRSLIYDNGASIKNKGVSFAMRRLRCHLTKFYRENKSNKGYALVIDFSKYFDNILHDKLFEMQKNNLTDERIFNLYKSFITVFGDGISLGLGSQVSQISAIAYPNKLDHYCKEVLRIKYYGRYMDDTYLIHKDKEYLEYCFSEIKRICNELGIKLNQKKTRIVSLDEGFWFLKGKYILLESGKIISKPARDGALRMRRKLRKFLKMVEDGTMSLLDVYSSYQSFRSHLMQFDSYHIIHNMDKYYSKLFVNNYSLLYDTPKYRCKKELLNERNKFIHALSRVTVKKMPLLSGV